MEAVKLVRHEQQDAPGFDGAIENEDQSECVKSDASSPPINKAMARIRRRSKKQWAGQALRVALDAHGITHDALADLMGVSRSTVTRMLDGHSSIGPEYSECWPEELQATWLCIQASDHDRNLRRVRLPLGVQASNAVQDAVRINTMVASDMPLGARAVKLAANLRRSAAQLEFEITRRVVPPATSGEMDAAEPVFRSES